MRVIHLIKSRAPLLISPSPSAVRHNPFHNALYMPIFLLLRTPLCMTVSGHLVPQITILATTIRKTPIARN